MSAKPKPLRPGTVAAYRSAVVELFIWIDKQPGLAFPLSHDDYARYLVGLWSVRTSSVALAHLAAIGWLCRERDVPFDSKAPALAAVIERIRDEERGSKIRRGWVHGKQKRSTADRGGAGAVVENGVLTFTKGEDAT